MNIRQQIFGQGRLGKSPIVTVKKPKGATADALLSIAVPRQESRRGDTRLGDRYCIADEAVRITHDGSTHDARLINVCASGAMVSAEFEPMPWDRAKLHLEEGRSIPCKVLWIRAGRIGLEFAEQIKLDSTQSAQAAQLRELIMRHFPEVQFESVAEPKSDLLNGRLTTSALRSAARCFEWALCIMIMKARPCGCATSPAMARRSKRPPRWCRARSRCSTLATRVRCSRRSCGQSATRPVCASISRWTSTSSRKGLDGLLKG